MWTLEQYINLLTLRNQKDVQMQVAPQTVLQIEKSYEILDICVQLD